MTITKQDTVIRKDVLVSANLSPTETVMLNIDKGAYYGMQDVARAIWDLLKEAKTVEALCDDLMTRFEVDEVTCQREVLTFLQDLHTEELIDVQSPKAG